MHKLTLLALILAVSAMGLAQGDHVPAYNHGPLKAGEVAPILPSGQVHAPEFPFAYQAHAYQLAAKIPNVLNQMPCYCYCERIGHKSLHTCFESVHGAHCGVCLKEVYYAYEQTKLKRTPAQIRAGIIKGDWQSVDLDKAAQAE